MSVCPKCKKEFLGKKKFCSFKCWRYSRKVICVICNKEFLGRYDSKYCSKECKKKAPKPAHSRPSPPREFYECRVCGVSKHYSNYRVDQGKLVKKRGWRGLDNKTHRTLCVPCERIDANKRYRADSSAIILAAIKKKCKLKNIKYEIDRDYLKSIMPDNMICPVMNKKMSIGKKLHRYSPTIDRIIPEKGYVKGNIIVISKIANAIKTDATIEQIEKVYEFYKKLL